MTSRIERYCSHLHAVRLDFIILVSGKAYTFSQVLIRFASLMENVLDSKMMCFVANPRKKVWLLWWQGRKQKMFHSVTYTTQRKRVMPPIRQQKDWQRTITSSQGASTNGWKQDLVLIWIYRKVINV